jgi:hypothetical protein
MQVAGQLLDAEALVVTTRQVPLGLLDYPIYRALCAWMSLSGRQKERKQMQPHGGKQGLNPGRTLLRQRVTALEGLQQL